MFAEARGWQAWKHCFLAMFPEGGQTRIQETLFPSHVSLRWGKPGNIVSYSHVSRRWTKQETLFPSRVSRRWTNQETLFRNHGLSS
jgi:hypothetical protein